MQYWRSYYAKLILYGLYFFRNQFTRITSVEQRRRYKTEFDNEYKEYRRLHEVLENASRKFAQYEDDLSHEPKDTQRYKVLKIHFNTIAIYLPNKWVSLQEIQLKILKEYERSFKNVKFQQDKERYVQYVATSFFCVT